MNLADRLDALLPQTQCTRCGFAACRPYAEALAAGQTTANLCEPGGQALVPALAALAGLPVLPAVQPLLPVQVARVREAECIGCARCLPACPVDAILGARRHSHTVIAQDCTGCGLCLPACPVDCIELATPASDWVAPTAADNRRRYAGHLRRWQRRAAPRAGQVALPGATVAEGTAAGSAPAAVAPSMAERRAALIARSRAAAAARREQS